MIHTSATLPVIIRKGDHELGELLCGAPVEVVERGLLPAEMSRVDADKAERSLLRMVENLEDHAAEWTTMLSPTLNNGIETSAETFLSGV
jgi:hypothetical protein